MQILRLQKSWQISFAQDDMGGEIFSPPQARLFMRSQRFLVEMTVKNSLKALLTVIPSGSEFLKRIYCSRGIYMSRSSSA